MVVAWSCGTDLRQWKYGEQFLGRKSAPTERTGMSRVKGIWAIFYHFSDVLLELMDGWACCNHSFIRKYSPGGAKCKQFPCFLFNFKLMVAVSDVEHGEVITLLYLVPEFFTRRVWYTSLLACWQSRVTWIFSGSHFLSVMTRLLI